MDCPYCNREMKLGHIKTGRQRLSWSPEGDKDPWFVWGISENGIQLGRYSLPAGGTTDAYCCHVCKKVIIDFVEP